MSADQIFSYYVSKISFKISYISSLVALFFSVFGGFYSQAILIPNREEKYFFKITLISAIMNVLLNMKSLALPVLKSQNNIVLINPMFCNETEGFSVFNTQQAVATIVLNENQYKEFKKLKIRHKKRLSTYLVNDWS